MKILITGANGQLGHEMQYLLNEKNISYFAEDAQGLDITNAEEVISYFEKHKPEIVYHCAAYTAVDKAEGEGRNLNWQVNVDGTINIAKACQKVRATLIYISTDYVFDGNRNSGEYLPNDVKGPRNEYGKAKLAGEEAVQKYCKKYYIVRTAWVYGENGHNFVYTMLNLAKTHKQLTVVDDQIGRPTWTRTLAEFLYYLVENHIEYGIYQCCNDDQCSWYEFAKEILKDTDAEVLPVSSDEYPTVAFRPHYSVMKLSKETGFKFLNWKHALHEFMEKIDK